MLAVSSRGARFASIVALWSHVCPTAGDPGVYEQVTSKVSSLATQLSEMELANSHSLEKWKRQFEQDLQAARKGNEALEQHNIKAGEENTKLAATNKELRQKAEGLRRDVKMWEADFRDMQANFSSSLEFTANTMTLLKDGQASQELNVLKELEHEETDAQAQQTRQRRLAVIRKANKKRSNNMLLLQVPDLAAHPVSFLRALDSDLQAIKDKHEQDKAQLAKQYKALMREEQARKQDLTKEGEELAKQHAELAGTQKSLQGAVKFLENTFNALESNARSLRMFASRIGIRPLPRGHPDLTAAINARSEVAGGADSATAGADSDREGEREGEGEDDSVPTEDSNSVDDQASTGEERITMLRQQQ